MLGILLVFCFSFGSTAQAATPNLKGTWTGSGKAATDKGYQPFTLTVKITSQSGTLIRGTVTVTQGGQSKKYGMSGCISGSKVYITNYETSSGETDTLVDVSLTTNNTKMTGTMRSVDSAAGHLFPAQARRVEPVDLHRPDIPFLPLCGRRLFGVFHRSPEGQGRRQRPDRGLLSEEVLHLVRDRAFHERLPDLSSLHAAHPCAVPCSTRS